MKLVLGIGSNLGDRISNIKNAIFELEKSLFCGPLKHSYVYETKALLKPNSNIEWDINYLNLVVTGEIELNPEEILEKIKKIECFLGRNKTETWAPRIIDIDILAYGEMVINKELLIIPHKELLNRKWCLFPFKEVYPEWRYPIHGIYYNKTIEELSKILTFGDDLYEQISE